MKEEKSFKLTISRVDEQLYSGNANAVTLPGTEGELTILAYHEPLVTMLKKGTVIVREGESVKRFSIDKGLLETSGNQVTVLV